MSRFRLLSVLGRGGTGTVYEAVREDGPGRRLALKLLHTGLHTGLHTDLRADLPVDLAPDRLLQRFRDEARMLALVRDRAVVWADLPIQLDAGWAVLMDLAPGANLARILEQTGPAPVPAAIELVGEVCRALHNLYNAAGPDGPLQLVHRDLKPSNLQISRSGEVRILDFGNAKARFTAREAHTTRHIGGTPGFIAPERLAGLDGPEGDIWSLGMVLRALLSPSALGRPTERTLPAGAPLPRPAELPAPPELPAPVLALLREMTEPSPEHRPTALQVARQARALLRELEGDSLTDWAERVVPLADAALPADERVGSVVESR